jgi:hypothetical protein
MGAQLGSPSDAAGPDASAGRQVGETPAIAGDQGIAWVGALGKRREKQSGCFVGWDVFQAMNGDVDRTVEKQTIDLLDEHAGYPELAQGNVDDAVAERPDGLNDEFVVREVLPRGGDHRIEKSESRRMGSRIASTPRSIHAIMEWSSTDRCVQTKSAKRAVRCGTLTLYVLRFTFYVLRVTQFSIASNGPIAQW